MTSHEALDAPNRGDRRERVHAGTGGPETAIDPNEMILRATVSAGCR
jgi:hypothetical protein